jgi:transcriptional regulator with XRE-family HTH domain
MKTARTEANLNQKEVADRMGISMNTIVEWELGRRIPRVDQLAQYCDICGCRPDDIYFD